MKATIAACAGASAIAALNVTTNDMLSVIDLNKRTANKSAIAATIAHTRMTLGLAVTESHPRATTAPTSSRLTPEQSQR
jgi:hypothetical protein